MESQLNVENKMKDYKIQIDMPTDIRDYFYTKWKTLHHDMKWSEYISGLTVAFLRSIKIAEEHKE